MAREIKVGPSRQAEQCAVVEFAPLGAWIEEGQQTVLIESSGRRGRKFPFIDAPLEIQL